MREEEAVLIKGGETVIHIGFRRSANGLRIWVKAHPIVEEFFARTLGTGEHHDVRTYGRYWLPAAEGSVLSVYQMNEHPTLLEILGAGYNLTGIGGPIIEHPRGSLGNDSIVNLSFLRLVGTSSPDGITFDVKGVFDIGTVRKIRERVVAATQSFYLNFMKPIDMTVQVITQET